MNTLEINTGIIAGAVALLLIARVAVSVLRSGRAAADENTRIYDRHISTKP